jgi:Zn-dependent protease with chaperone function
MRRSARVTAVLLGLAVLALLWPAGALADQTSDEIALGAKIAKQIESQYRVVTDPAMVDRLNTVAAALVPVVDRQDITYHFKILDIPGPNAVGIPGGWVYVTKGMMKFVRSDDELAAVLAHELTHVAHRHYYIEQQRQKAMLPALIVAAALSVLARSAGPLIGTAYATQGALANYQRDLEREADLNGITYLRKTRYSPVAMLTLMEHLAQADKMTGHPDPGDIYLDHPRPDERVAYIRQDLAALNIPISRRTPEGFLRLTMEPPSPEAGEAVTILVDGRPVLRVGAAAQGQPPAARARTVMQNLDAFFNTDPGPYDVRAVNLLDQWEVLGGQTRIFQVTAQDAAYARLTPQALAEQFRARLAEAIAADLATRKF